MTPQTQKNLSDISNGVYGDCWRTVIACLMDLPRDEVPCPYEGVPPDRFQESWPDVRMRMMAWLAVRGKTIIGVQFPADISLRDVLATVGAQNPGLHYMLVGNSRNGTGHIVICLDDQIVWDPSIDQSGIVGPCGPDENNRVWYVEFLGCLV